MASRIPDSRLGRALMAGIPVALFMLGGEIVDGDWDVERVGNGLVLSWSPGSDRDAAMPASEAPMVRLGACLGQGCERWTLAISVPRPHIAVQIIGIAQSIRALMPGDCPEQRRSHGALITA